MINSYLSRQITQNFPYDPTEDQVLALNLLSNFLLSEESDSLLLLKGYAGTGKTSLVGALVKTMTELKQKSILLAPTGRAAKVFSGYAGQKAFTIHKKIYRQKAFSKLPPDPDGRCGTVTSRHANRKPGSQSGNIAGI